MTSRALSFKYETPAATLKQYDTLKAKHPDALLLFRAGDNYETYKGDAVKAAEALQTRLFRAPFPVIHYLTRIPAYDLDTALPRLIRAGFRVAICDQLPPPKPQHKPAQ